MFEIGKGVKVKVITSHNRLRNPAYTVPVDNNCNRSNNCTLLLMIQVEMAEAELDYINGQTDNMLSNIDGQLLQSNVKKSIAQTAADEIEFQLNVRNKNFLNRCRSDRNLLEDETTITEREKLLSPAADCRGSKQDIRKGLAGYTSTDSKRVIMSRGANDAGSHQPVDPHKCSLCTATTFKWSAPPPRRPTTVQCTFCKATDCSVRNNQTRRLNLNNTTQHNAATCNWKRVQSTGRNTGLSDQKLCPLCAFPGHLSQSISDLGLSSLETQCLQLLSHRSQPDISNLILDNNYCSMHCSTGGCHLQGGKPRHSSQLRNNPQQLQNANRRRRMSCAERSLSSSYSTQSLFNPTKRTA